MVDIYRFSDIVSFILLLIRSENVDREKYSWKIYVEKHSNWHTHLISNTNNKAICLGKLEVDFEAKHEETSV